MKVLERNLFLDFFVLVLFSHFPFVNPNFPLGNAFMSAQNIGARRLYTMFERLLEELSFEAPEMKMGRVEINAAYVEDRLKEVAEDEDLSRFIL